MSIQNFKAGSVFWKNMNAIHRAKRIFRPIKDDDLTETDLFNGFLKWRFIKYRHRRVDGLILKLLDVDECGTAQDARRALFLTASSVAKKMGVSPSKYSKLESAEAQEKITLKNLIQMAQAMDCELIYAIRPKNGQLFSEIIWDQIVDESRMRWRARACSPHNRHGALAAVAEELVRDPDFRRKRKWSRNE